MPEGHTIHRIVKYQRRILVGKTLQVHSPQGRFADGAQQVHGRTLKALEPLGKHLFYHFDDSRIVHVHLGMHGRYRYTRFDGGELPPPRGQIRMRLVTGDRVVDLSGPTACEVLDEKAVQAIRDRIGPDLLSDHPDREAVWQRVSRSRTPIAVLLMDQSVLSGIGNVYRSELLYRQSLDPRQPANTLTRVQFDALWHDAIHLLRLGVKHGIIVTVEPDERTKRAKTFRGRDRDRFYVYRRETCLRCGGPVERFEMAGRTVYMCPNEQPTTAGGTSSRASTRRATKRPTLTTKPAGRTGVAEKAQKAAARKAKPKPKPTTARRSTRR